MELRDTVTACIVGATGLVGGRLLDRLVDNRRFERVITAGRRAPEKEAAGLTHHVVDLTAADDLDVLAADVVFCCLGTTIARAGSRQAFRAVDHDLVLSVAAGAHAAGVTTFIAVSSLGADAGTGNFYLRTKGETEEALADIGFERLGIVRPSLLLGARDESRPAEALGQLASRLVNPLLLGPFRKYRSIDADAVARAMIALEATDFDGVKILESDAIVRLSENAG